jgi:hypothetical protein
MPLQVRAMPWKLLDTQPTCQPRCVHPMIHHHTCPQQGGSASPCWALHISSMAASFLAASPSSVSRLHVPARTYNHGHRIIKTRALAVLYHL